MRRNVLGSMLLRGYFPWEGASSATEMLYLARTARHANARLVGETGFDTGFSSRAFLQAHPDARVVSFDVCENRWTGIAKELIDKQFPGRHTLICGDSRDTVPKFRANSPELRFDLVFIDGGHSYECIKADTETALKILAPNGVIVWDDYAWFTGGVSQYLTELRHSLPLYRIAGSQLVIWGGDREPISTAS